MTIADTWYCCRSNLLAGGSRWNVLRAGGVLERCPLTRDGRNSVHPSLMIVVVDLLDREVGEHDLKHGRRTPAGGGPAWPLGQRPPAHAPATVCQSSVCMHRSNRCEHSQLSKVHLKLLDRVGWVGEKQRPRWIAFEKGDLSGQRDTILTPPPRGSSSFRNSLRCFTISDLFRDR